MSEPAKSKESRRSPCKKGYVPQALIVLGLVIAAAAIALLRDKPDVPTDGPSLAQQVLAKARPLVSKGQYGQAIVLMLAYLREYPDDIEVRPLLAEAQMGDGELQQAEKTTDQVLLRAPEMSKALWLKGLLLERRSEDPSRVFRRAAESPDSSGEIWASYGVRLLEGGDHELAEDYLNRARSAGIADARTLGPLGQLALQNGQLERAESLLTDALKTAPRSGRLYAMLAEAQIRSGKTRLAADTLSQAASDPSCPPELLLRAAMVQLDVGRARTAKAYLERASQLLPGDPRCDAVRRSIANREAAESPPR